MFESSFTQTAQWGVPGVDRAAEPVQLPEPVQRLQDAVETLRTWQPCELAGPAALAATRAVLQAEQTLLAIRTRALADVEQRSLHQIAQTRSTGAWVREQGVTVPAGELALARGLAGLPLVAEELTAGRLPLGAATRLQSAIGRLRRHVDRPDGTIDGQPGEQVLSGVVCDGVLTLVAEALGGPQESDPVLHALADRLHEVYVTPAGQLARLEAALVALAHHVPVGQLSAALDQLVDALLPGQLEDRAGRGQEVRGLALVRKSDGSGWRLTGELDLECGERLHTVLQAELARDPANPLDTAAAAGLRAQGLDPTTPTTPTTRSSTSGRAPGRAAARSAPTTPSAPRWPATSARSSVGRATGTPCRSS